MLTWMPNIRLLRKAIPATDARVELKMNQQREMQAGRRKRRRQRRLVSIAGFLLFTTGMAWFFELQATTTIIVARYAEKASLTDADPELAPLGQQRAIELARVLGNVDVIAGVDAIFVLPQRRSVETSMPLATLNNAPVHTIDAPEDVEALVLRILDEYKGKIVLVITEPDIIQPLIAEMQGSKNLPEMAETEHDNLYIVSIPWFGKVKTLRLRYGLPYQS
jgi:broad specificity phosphatase PhoE